MIRTLMAEANPVARLGMRSLLGAHADVLEIDEAGSLDELLGKLRERYYEFIIVEPAMSGAGTSLVGRLRELSPWSNLLVLTELDELSFGVDAIRAGAKGYLMKTATRDEMRTAVRRVANGRLYFSKALATEIEHCARKFDGRNKPHESFRKREFQVFSLTVCGMTPIESAYVLQMRTEQVADFRHSVMSRLGVKTPHEMVEYATQQGLLPECRNVSSELWAGRYGQHGVMPESGRAPVSA
ncbi:Oxygen regulatory protein NreC [Massilia sp. Bi118]|uniref:response regulator transcription factor n=1 Tax=Massilia sp. Bi118 TaxID=2822346 RepID=UPI001DFD834D|nr:response regulator transcription factor [Massilia sp. Bi118]CAH0316699.1 Oxygen regulatory protein NreC [Massilia sp. Bi118]